jgi:hypothetical protein
VSRENTEKPKEPIKAFSVPISLKISNRKGKRLKAIIIRPIAIKLFDNIIKFPS